MNQSEDFIKDCVKVLIKLTVVKEIEHVLGPRMRLQFIYTVLSRVFLA